MQSLRRLCRTIITWEWVFLLLILPAVLLPSPRRSLALLVIPLLWLARKIGHGRFIPATPVDGSLFGLLLMVLVSLYATFDIAFSFPKVAGVVYGVALFYAVVEASGRGERRLWASTGLLLLSGWGVVALSLVGARWPRKLPVVGGVLARLPQQVALPGDFDAFNANEVAGTLLWVAPLALILAVVVLRRATDLRARLPRRQAWGVLLFVPLTALALNGMLVLTQSRSGLLGAAVALASVALVPAGRFRRWLLAGLVVLVVAGGIFVASVGVEETTSTLFAQAGVSGDDLGDAMNTLEGRQEIWSRAIYGLQDFPFTGMGMNTFRRVVHILYPLFLVAPDTDIAHAHNHLLQAGLDLGLPGLIAYLAVWLGTGLMLWQVWQRGETVWHRALAVGTASSLLAYFVYGMTDAVALGARPGFIFWLLLGLVAGVHRRVVGHETPTR